MSWRRLGGPSDHNACLTVSHGEGEGRWNDSVLDSCVVLGKVGEGIWEFSSHSCHRGACVSPGGSCLFPCHPSSNISLLVGLPRSGTGQEHRSGDGFQSIQTVEALGHLQSLQLEVYKAHFPDCHRSIKQ